MSLEPDAHDRAVAVRICARHGIQVKALETATGSFEKRVSFINDELLLRVSELGMEGEQEKFRRVAALDYVPRIVHAGVFEGETGPIYYTLLTLMPGDDFVSAFSETTVAQQRQLGKDLAAWLDDLHAYTGTAYDIGLYVPVIPGFSGTWRAGHQEYWGLLRQGADALALNPHSVGVLESAFRYLEASADALAFQAGPKLLHNDLHPMNILVNRGCFSGVIDWECSQYGEADFELCHFIHWCMYPPRPDTDYRPFLGALFQSSPACAQARELAVRLTLYQIEHEIQQIIWQGSPAEAVRVPRIIYWMDGGVDDLLRQVL